MEKRTFNLTNNTMKKVFVPLYKKYYLKIKNGEQDCEIRPLGHRGWNKKNIYPGRPIVFSNGYGNYDRTEKTILRVVVTDDLKKESIAQWHIDAVNEIYGKRDQWLIAYI